MILAVIGLQDHEPLVSRKNRLNLVNTRFHPERPVPFLLLDRIGSFVQGQEEKADRQAQHDHGPSGAAGIPERNGINCVQQQLNRPQNQLLKNLPYAHESLPASFRTGIPFH